jgi:2-hydroxychromene-2-carboxylate isomerase
VAQEIDPNKTAVVWYDFSCPYSYLGQHRTSIVVQHGLPVVELPFQADREIPAEGLLVKSRNGPMYSELARAAKEIGVRLNWSIYVPNTRGALACAEWVRLRQPAAFPRFHKALFDAHFVFRDNLSNPDVIFRHATECGVDMGALHTALADGSAGAALWEAESLAKRSGVRTTPAWLIGRQLITKLLPAEEFERLAHQGIGTNLTA